jgi:hypothetical protein
MNGIHTIHPKRLAPKLCVVASLLNASFAVAQASPTPQATAPSVEGIPGEQGAPPSQSAPGAPATVQAQVTETPTPIGPPAPAPTPQTVQPAPLAAPPAPASPPTGFDSYAQDTATEDSERKASQWYGLPLVVVDGLALAVIGIGRAAESENVVSVGIATGMVNGLLVHTFSYPPRQRGAGLGKGFLSLLMRAGAGLGACAVGEGCFEQHIGDAALARLVGGLVVAAIVDDAFLARRTLSTRAESARVHVEPTAVLASGTVQFGAGGSW